jgi:hypothetical protein
MEHVVEARPLRQLQTIGHLSDALQDSERPCIARAKLALGARLEGLGGAVEEAQPHPITHRELHVTMTCVVILLGELLGL